MSYPIRPNPQGVPHTQAPHSQIPIRSDTITPSDQCNRAANFHRIAAEAFRSTDMLGRRVEKFKILIDHVNDPAFHPSTHFQTFKELVGAGICEKICRDVSLAITQNVNLKEGERLLQQNFLVILRLKDSDGNNPLDKILEQFSSERETFSLIGEINYLASAIVMLQNAVEATQGQSILKSPQLFNEAKRLEQDAIDKFDKLTQNARGVLCEQLWKNDGELQIYNYGYDTAKANITKLLYHNEKCIAEQCISTLEAKKNPTFTFNTHLVYAETISPTSDSLETTQNIQRLYYLEDLRIALSDPNRDNNFHVSKHNRLSPKLKEALKDVRELLCKIIAIASYKPQTDTGFGEHILNVNMRWLVKTQNKQGQTVIDQLISHYTAKVQLSRLEREINEFFQTSGKIVAESPNSPNREKWLNAFNHLTEQAQKHLRYKVWYYDGGKADSKFCYGDHYYGKRMIESDPHCLFRSTLSGFSILKACVLELQDKQKNANNDLLAQLEKAKTLPDEPIDVSTKPLEQEVGLIDHLPANVRVAVVTAEFEPAGLGGLRPAVSGMVRAFGANDTRVVMPYYQNGIIKQEIIDSMKVTDHEIWVAGKRTPVMKANLTGVRCYFIAHDAFWIPKKVDGSSGNFYEGDYHHVRWRWAVFQKAAADLCYNFSKKRHPVQLVHCHDAQTALVPKFLKEHHFEEWMNGITPVTHFTYHNNGEPMAYESDESISILERVQLPKKPLNSFIEALQIADVKSTVSLRFGKESQMQHSDFGNGLHDFVKKTAFEENLFGVVNGNTIDWNPRIDTQKILQNWISVLPDTKGLKVDLRFGPDSNVQELAQNTVRIQRELCAYLKGLHSNDPGYADLDPEKPIIMYLGRYDSRQKGVNKLPIIMHEAINSGAQFVCVGLEPDEEAKHTLSDMNKFAKERKNKGVLILVDSKGDKGLVYQGVFGSLLRAATFPIFPSRYEPCGLVQGESNCFGRTPIATDTGGFGNTLQTKGPNANGYLFKRCENWDSPEQDEEIRITLRQAIIDAIAIQKALYEGSIADVTPHMERTKRIMKNALNSTWERTPDGSPSPIVKRQLIDAKGFQRLKLRGGAGYVELNTLKL